MIVWEPEKKTIRKAARKELFEAVYLLTQLIPIGKVTSYGDLSRILGISPRLVGVALKENRNLIVVPCHRVVMSNGRLGGYTSGGTAFKKRLLELEGVEFVNGRVSPKSFVDLSNKLLTPNT
ncbi:MAG: cysteine methyltransferase [Thermoprotei archaeon]|nr:MAG: cysteine methyltransferase [Thermoprotei archaeon]